MKYKVLVDGRFGEGWKKGDIVAIDDAAAAVPLEEGAIEAVVSEEDQIKKKPGRPSKQKQYAEQTGAGEVL